MKVAFWAAAGCLGLVAASCSGDDRDFSSGNAGTAGQSDAGAPGGGATPPVGGGADDGGQPAAGSGGMPPSLPMTGLGDVCDESGALACNGSAQKLSLLCKGGVWVESTVCKSDENCDQATGVCTPILAECEGKLGDQLYCGEDDTVFRCGPDLVSTEEVEKCVGKCVPSAASGVCVPITCGNGVPEAPEECDDGNDDETDDCTNACTNAKCGDGSLQTGEECDDKNEVSGDGCSKACAVEAVQIVGLSDRVCALGANGQIRCFTAGKASFDVLSIPLPTGVKATSIAGDNAHFCALLSGGQLRCWGNNEFGQLGLNDKVTRDFSSPSANVILGAGVTATSVAVGFGHTCAVLAGGNTKCWGRNDDGELGIETTQENPALGDEAGEMGESLPTVAMLDGLSRSVSAGSGTTCVIASDKTAHCFGWGTEAVLTAAGNVNLGSVSTVQQLAISNGCYCAVLTDKSLKCWGGNGAGQLGQDDTKPRSTPATMGDNLKPVNLGQGKFAQSVYMLGTSTLVILNDGSVKGWGDNSNGVLGRGDRVLRVGGSVGDMASLELLSLPTGRKARQLGLSNNTYCALLDDGSITCWGLAPNVVLGDDPNEMGNKLPIVALTF